jgi:hypothetical protein
MESEAIPWAYTRAFGAQKRCQAEERHSQFDDLARGKR